MSLVVRAVTCRFDTVGTVSASAVSSWKCVAKKQNDPIIVAMCLDGRGADTSGHTCVRACVCVCVCVFVCVCHIL